MGGSVRLQPRRGALVTTDEAAGFDDNYSDVTQFFQNPVKTTPTTYIIASAWMPTNDLFPFYLLFSKPPPQHFVVNPIKFISDLPNLKFDIQNGRKVFILPLKSRTAILPPRNDRRRPHLHQTHHPHSHHHNHRSPAR